MTDKKNGREYLGYVLEKLKERITENQPFSGGRPERD